MSQLTRNWSIDTQWSESQSSISSYGGSQPVDLLDRAPLSRQGSFAESHSSQDTLDESGGRTPTQRTVTLPDVCSDSRSLDFTSPSQGRPLQRSFSLYPSSVLSNSGDNVNEKAGETRPLLCSQSSQSSLSGRDSDTNAVNLEASPRPPTLSQLRRNERAHFTTAKTLRGDDVGDEETDIYIHKWDAVSVDNVAVDTDGEVYQFSQSQTSDISEDESQQSWCDYPNGSQEIEC